MKALVDLFWGKYSDLRQAIEINDQTAMATLDRELDPLMLAIFESQSKDPLSIQAQFRFALDLLNEEADDRGCVRRNAHLLQMLVERYVSPEIGPSNIESGEEPSISAEATAGGVLNDALLNRISDRVVVVAPGYRIFYTNETNARRLDLSREELIGRHYAEFVGLHRFKSDIRPALDRCLAGESVSLTYAEEVNGETTVVRCRMSPCLSGTSTLIGAMVVMQESADRRKRNAA